MKFWNRIALAGACALGVVATVGAGRAGSVDIAEMTDAATTMLASLDEEQRASATFAFDDEERMRFHFIPIEMFERRGVMIAGMTEPQRERAHDLLRAGLSQKGYLTATQIMALEDVLLALEGGDRRARDRDEYFFSFFGTPAPDASWAWRFEGHHLSLHFTVVAGEVTVASPAFVGANPAEVREGPQAGSRPLGDREDAGRAVVMALDPAQRRQAIIQVDAPRDILTGNAVRVDPLAPVGIAVAELEREQQERVMDLIDIYLSLMADDIAQARMSRLSASDVGEITFAWAGSVEPGEPHYYRVQGPTFLIEYDNTQNDANHIHSVWRDFQGDFGEDLLREHRARVPHH
jgi:hypothetical protein